MPIAKWITKTSQLLKKYEGKDTDYTRCVVRSLRDSTARDAYGPLPVHLSTHPVAPQRVTRDEFDEFAHLTHRECSLHPPHLSAVRTHSTEMLSLAHARIPCAFPLVPSLRTQRRVL